MKKDSNEEAKVRNSWASKGVKVSLIILYGLIIFLLLFKLLVGDLHVSDVTVFIVLTILILWYLGNKKSNNKKE